VLWFISGSRSKIAGYDPHAFAIGASFLVRDRCVALATLSIRLRLMRRKMRQDRHAQRSHGRSQLGLQDPSNAPAACSRRRAT